jgi:hypothetical protein
VKKEKRVAKSMVEAINLLSNPKSIPITSVKRAVGMEDSSRAALKAKGSERKYLPKKKTIRGESSNLLKRT